MANGLDIDATQNDKYNFVIAITTGELRIDEIKDWLKKHVVEI